MSHFNYSVPLDASKGTYFSQLPDELIIEILLLAPDTSIENFLEAFRDIQNSNNNIGNMYKDDKLYQKFIINKFTGLYPVFENFGMEWIKVWTILSTNLKDDEYEDEEPRILLNIQNVFKMVYDEEVLNIIRQALFKSEFRQLYDKLIPFKINLWDHLYKVVKYLYSSKSDRLNIDIDIDREILYSLRMDLKIFEIILEDELAVIFFREYIEDDDAFQELTAYWEEFEDNGSNKINQFIQFLDQKIKSDLLYEKSKIGRVIEDHNFELFSYLLPKVNVDGLGELKDYINSELIDESEKMQYLDVIKNVESSK